MTIAIRLLAFVALVLASAALVLASAAAPLKCPASASMMHAGCEVPSISFRQGCDAVRNEISKRVEGQFDAWHDPHNNGTYTMIKKEASLFQLSRLTGDKKYVDLINFSFSDNAGGGCDVAACSESQSMSIGDYGTNFCNIFVLYCNEARCNPFQQLDYAPATVGKCTEQSPNKCFTV